MKKIYQNPDIKIVAVQMAQMIAASNPKGFKGGLGGDDDGGDGNDGLSRRHGNLWDDED